MAKPNWNNRTLFVADKIRILRGMNSESVDCIATDHPAINESIEAADRDHVVLT